MVIERLNELKDVKYHEETGLVQMKRGEVWYVLCRSIIWYGGNEPLIADYENLEIKYDKKTTGQIRSFVCP
jgi:hypothetical protein